MDSCFKEHALGKTDLHQRFLAIPGVKAVLLSFPDLKCYGKVLICHMEDFSKPRMEDALGRIGEE